MVTHHTVPLPPCLCAPLPKACTLLGCFAGVLSLVTVRKYWRSLCPGVLSFDYLSGCCSLFLVFLKTCFPPAQWPPVSGHLGVLECSGHHVHLSETSPRKVIVSRQGSSVLRTVVFLARGTIHCCCLRPSSQSFVVDCRRTQRLQIIHIHGSPAPLWFIFSWRYHFSGFSLSTLWSVVVRKSFFWPLSWDASRLGVPSPLGRSSVDSEVVVGGC